MRQHFAHRLSRRAHLHIYELAYIFQHAIENLAQVAQRATLSGSTMALHPLNGNYPGSHS